MSDDIDQLLALSEDDLLVQVGESLRQGGMGFAHARPILFANGVHWWNDNKEAIARHICTNARLCGVYASQHDDDRALVALLIDILGSVTVAGPVPLGTLSVLCVKKGLTWICGAGWPDPAWKPAA